MLACTAWRTCNFCLALHSLTCNPVLVQALVMRLEGLRAAGRRVVLVGDYNITYDPKDHCEPGPHFLDNRPDRQMLMGLLPPRGPFLDTFRVFQPHRSSNPLPTGPASCLHSVQAMLLGHM